MDTLIETTTRPSLDCIFRPRLVAVVGASSRRGGIGREILENLMAMPFQGAIYPVNSRVDVLHCVKCYPRVRDIPDPVDLAILVVPANGVLDVVDDCAARGVKGIVVITAGFKEIGGAGLELEDRLLERVRHYGMRMIGPNCMGVINTHPDVAMNATFARTMPLRGRLGFLSQSGAMGAVILDYANTMGLGLSMFASLGNKADVSGNELLEYWKDDPDTDIILLYLENFGNPRRFSALAREISRRKPIIAVKAGRTAAGASAAISHTGALAGLDVAVDALFDQCGVLRVASLQEMFDLARYFLHQRPPCGPRVAVVSNGGGPGIMTTDAVVSAGLQMATFSEETRERLRHALPLEASSANPVDLIASADPGRYRMALDTVLADPGVDACIVIFVSTVAFDPSDMIPAVEEAARHSSKPVLASYMGAEAQGDKVVSGVVPVYPFPEEAVRVLVDAVRYGRRLATPEGGVIEVVGDRARARALMAAGPPDSGRCFELLKSYGIPCAARRDAADLAAALRAAQETGYPLVLKTNVPGLSHKSDVGGVVVDLRTPAELEQAWRTMQERLAAHLGAHGPFPVEVQEMVRGGREVIVGVMHDPKFGPLIMFGLGGVHVEVFQDVSFRVHPLTDRSAREMIREIRGHRLLEGVRGEASVDFDFLESVLHAVSQMVTDLPELAEMDLNPIMVGSDREHCKVVDARIGWGP
ncbi:MAG: acetate--CoA ligase family protein [Armatimonadetes bacterium]|nr:acetate--CoA ligase family protein [Armatimonadota bacterium]